MSAPTFQARFLHPRYWPTWFGIGLMWLLHWLPIRLQIRLGEGLGWLVGRLLRGRRRVVDVNLALCFPQLDAAARAARTDAHFKALGAGLFEAALAWFAPDWRLRGRGTVEGLEHLDAALAGGRGVLLLTGHFTTLELGARYIAMQPRPFHAMYRPYSNAVMDHYMHHWREARSGLPALPRDDLRRLVKALRQGRAIWYAPDQTLDQRISVFAPFFGHPAASITATARLAEMGRARVVPYFPMRRPDGRYVVRFLPALENFPAGDEAADAARINAVIEEGIRAAPEQYFWVHKRFKRQPDGAPNPYRR